MNWLYIDDLNTLTWFRDIDDGSLGFAGVLGLWNNEHPIGTQVALLWLLRAIAGLDFKVVVDMSLVLVALTACMAARCASDSRRSLGMALAIDVACFAMAFHPTQMEHLLWAFEIGWFLVNTVVLANLLLGERFGHRSVWLSALLCAVASLASAQGAFTWFAAALHQALLPSGRRTRAAAALLLSAGGILALARIGMRPHLSDGPPTSRGLDPIGGLVYALQVLGGLSGSHDHAVLLAMGGTLVMLTGVLLWTRRATAERGRLRASLILIFFSALCVAAFAEGRRYLGIDWAVASFHAAPFLVPFALGLIVLIATPRPPGRGARFDVAAGITVTFLAVGVVSGATYGVTRARLWAMDRGYARWATCHTDLPLVVQARGSGVAFDLAGFEADLPLIRQMCAGPTGFLETQFRRRPAQFDAWSEGHPEIDRALEILWQDYATDLMLQLAIKPWDADLPARLVGFAKRNADKGSELDPVRLAPYADIYRSLAP